MATEFKKGDKVKFGGVVGEVTQDRNTQALDGYPILVVFPKDSEWFTKDGKLLETHTEPLLILVERPKVAVLFKDWEDGKKYNWDEGNTVYTKKDGLPYRVVLESYSANPLTFFAHNKFYEVD